MTPFTKIWYRVYNKGEVILMEIEELRARIIELEENNQSLSNELEHSKKQIEDNEKRILSLQEHNQRLFLKTTVQVEEEVKEDKLTIDSFLQSIKI